MSSRTGDTSEARETALLVEAGTLFHAASASPANGKARKLASRRYLLGDVRDPAPTGGDLRSGGGCQTVAPRAGRGQGISIAGARHPHDLESRLGKSAQGPGMWEWPAGPSDEDA